MGGLTVRISRNHECRTAASSVLAPFTKLGLVSPAGRVLAHSPTKAPARRRRTPSVLYLSMSAGPLAIALRQAASGEQIRGLVHSLRATNIRRNAAIP